MTRWAREGRSNHRLARVRQANLANLYSLVATCEANGVEPTAYLADVLMRLSTHPAAELDALLPQDWAHAA